MLFFARSFSYPLFWNEFVRVCVCVCWTRCTNFPFYLNASNWCCVSVLDSYSNVKGQREFKLKLIIVINAQTRIPFKIVSIDYVQPLCVTNTQPPFVLIFWYFISHIVLWYVYTWTISYILRISPTLTGTTSICHLCLFIL